MDLEKLKAAALAATPGEWKLQRLTGGYHNVGIRVTGHLVSGYTAFINTRWPHEGQRMEQEANAAYIAAANPAAMLELIAEIERLRKYEEAAPEAVPELVDVVEQCYAAGKIISVIGADKGGV